MEKVYLQQASFHMCGMSLGLPEQVSAARKMGYSGLELAGNFDEMIGWQVKQLFLSNGLQVLGAHVPLSQMDAKLPLMQELEARYMVVPNHLLRNREEALRLAEKLNDQGKKMKVAGMMFGYHNHNTEFIQDCGDYLLQILMDQTDPELVFFEYDVGWAAASGADVTKFLRKNADRIKLIHANESDQVLGPGVGRQPQEIPRDANGNYEYTQEEMEYNIRRKTCDCPMGKGIPDWAEILEAATSAEAYIVERRYSYLPDPCQCFAQDLAYLNTF